MIIKKMESTFSRGYFYLNLQDLNNRVRETQFPLTYPSSPPPTVGVIPLRQAT